MTGEWVRAPRTSKRWTMNEEILKRIDALAAKLGVAAEHVWGVLIKQARVEAATDAVGFILSLVCAYWLIRWARYMLKTGKDGDGIIWIPFALCAFFVLVAGIGSFSSIPTNVFNPEYFALKTILGR